MLLPSRREDFLYGRTPKELREWVEEKHGKKVAEKLGRKLRPWVTNFFFGVWCQYNSKMVEGEHEFASRIRTRYGVCASDLKRYGKGARPTTTVVERSMEQGGADHFEEQGHSDETEVEAPEREMGGDVTLGTTAGRGGTDMNIESTHTLPPHSHI